MTGSKYGNCGTCSGALDPQTGDCVTHGKQAGKQETRQPAARSTVASAPLSGAAAAMQTEARRHGPPLTDGELDERDRVMAEERDAYRQLAQTGTLQYVRGIDPALVGRSVARRFSRAVN